MLQVGLCDDEPVLLDTLEEKVRRCFSENLIFAEIQAFTGGQNLLYEAEDGKRFDLLLLDIEMPGMDGLELASRLRLLLPDALLIFITSHVEFALDAYELSTFRYIPKNIWMAAWSTRFWTRPPPYSFSSPSPILSAIRTGWNASR